MNNNALSSVLATLANGLLTALFAGIAAGFVAELCAQWSRVGNAEGARGFYVLFRILGGAVAGFFIGLVCAQLAPAGNGNPFLRGLALSAAVVSGGLLVITLVAYLQADLPPRLNGRRLELEVELRLPPAAPGRPEPDLQPMVTLHGASSGACSWTTASSNVVTDAAGRRILPAILGLASSHPRKVMLVSWSAGPTLTYPLPLPARPGDADFRWSDWLNPAETATPSPETRPDAADARQLRYRVRYQPEPAPRRSAAEEKVSRDEAVRARFAALTSESPLAGWLEFAAPYSEAGLQPAALQGIAARTNLLAELTTAAAAPEASLAADILRTVPRLPVPAPRKVELTLATGRVLLERMKQTIDTPEAADPGYNWAMQLDALFLGWHTAAEELHAEAPDEFAGQLRDILQLARRRPDSQALHLDVVRIASYYLQKWTGEAPLPTDPPPR